MANFFKKAEELLQHPDKLLSILSKGFKKAYDKRSIFVHLFEEFLLLLRLVRAWVLGEYHEAPRKVILWAVFAIIYFLSPLDALPDILPGGYIDDIALIGFIMNRIREDLDRFKEWEKSRR